MEKNKTFYKKVVEGILFCAGRAVSLRELSTICDGLYRKEISKILEELKIELEGRAFRLKEVANGYRVETIPEISEYLRAFLKPKSFRWTRPLVETLAIVAYFQPITKAEISAKRGGVEVTGPLKILLENNFIKVVGRKEVPGRPLLYGTTSFFLEYFGLKSLKDLPSIEELKKLIKNET